MKIFKYFIVGGIAATVDITIFFVFAKLIGLNYFVIGALGFIIATFVNYIISIRLVFHSRARFTKKLEITYIYIVSAVGLLTNQLILYTAVDIINLELMFSKLLATGTVFIWNYSIRNFYIFKAVKNDIQKS